jgi:hypothetical protein
MQMADESEGQVSGVKFAIQTSERGHQKWALDTVDGTLMALASPLAREYAENLLLQNDMHGSLATMEVWQRKFASSKDLEERLIGASLFRDAIVQFVECFDTTAQFPLSAQDIYGHDPEGVRSFQWFKDTMDAYASHKFGAQRQCVVGVILKADGQRGIGHLAATYRGQNKEDGDQLRGFMQTAADFLDGRTEQLLLRLIDEVQKMTDAEFAAKEVSVSRNDNIP